jgi:hypothetical protein
MIATRHDTHKFTPLGQHLNIQANAEPAKKNQMQPLHTTLSSHLDRSYTLLITALDYLTEDSSYRGITLVLNYALEVIQDPGTTAFYRVRGVVGLLVFLKQRRLLDLGDPQALLAIYQELRHLIRIATFEGLSVDSRLRVVARTDTLATTGAVVAIRQGQHDTAIEILEDGRAFFWLQYLRLRVPFEDLPVHFREQLDAAARKLESLSPDEEDTFDGEMAAEHYKMGQHFESLVAEVRSHPGFRRFLTPCSYAELSLAANPFPVVVLVPAEECAYALIFHGNGMPLHCITLPSVSAAELYYVGQSLRTSNVNSREPLRGRGMRVRKGVKESSQGRSALGILWKAVCQPIAEHLYFTVRICLSNVY